MDLPAALFAIRWLVRDTLRQARAAGITWVLLAATLLCAGFCLTLGISGEQEKPPLRPWERAEYIPRSEADKLPREKIEGSGVDVPTGEFTLLFGTFRVPLNRTRVEAVRLVQLLLAGGLADTAGVLLALIWTAGFLPSFLEPASVSVLLAKPVPRWALLVGKFLGVLAFVAIQAFIFLAATWFALGTSTGVWSVDYFLGLPILLTHFAVFYAVSALLAVTTRSTVACALGTIGFWLLTWGVNYARHASPGEGVLNVAYWLLPKPADLGVLLLEALRATDYFVTQPALKAVSERGGLYPELTVATSFLLPAAALAFAARRLSRADY